MGSIETNVKKYITSLLTSTPLVVTIQQLNKDYRNTIGESIPYEKLGYNSLEHFLRCIPDTVQLKGTGPTSVVTPIITEKSAHVNKLVTSQKVITKKKHGFTQKRVKTLFPPQYNCPVAPPEPIFDKPSPLPPRKIYYPVKKEVSISPVSPLRPISSCNGKPQPDSMKSYSEPSANNNNVSSLKCTFKNDYNKPFKETNLFAGTRHSLDSNKSDENVNNTPLTMYAKSIKKKLHNDLDRVSEDQLENSVPLEIRNNLRILIKSCPEGIWCAEVPEKYRKMFRKELDYNDLGFKSLIHLCVCLSSIFHYVRPAMEDYKLYDRSSPLPDCAEKTFTMASYGTSCDKKNRAETDSDSTALPALDWNDVKRFLPPDIYMPGQEIPRMFVSHEVKENDTIDVTIGEIYDLSKFWVYETDSQLDQLMDDMQEFYKQHSQEYLIPDHLIKEGIYCVQMIFGEYHRAFIVNTMPELEDTIRVVFIDYGTMTKVSTKGLCFLHVQFSELEAQAIRCRLANVCPVEDGAPWSKEASKAFRRLLKGRDITAKINRINREDQFLEVYLADVTDENNIFYINDKLVEEGFAQRPDKERKPTLVDPIYTPIVKFIHLFPTFLELEHGLAPSTLEMELFQECDLPINFCYPQYFFVDHSREEKIIEAAEAFHEKNCIKDRRRTSTSRYFDLEQYKSKELDLSIFGDLRQEMTEFLGMLTQEEYRENSDEDFVDAEEREDDRPVKCEVIIEEVNAKDDETVKLLKEDLLVAENIINKISLDESQEMFHVDGRQNNYVDGCVNLQESRWQNSGSLEEAYSTAIKDENLDVSRDSKSPVDLLNHPLSVMTFEEVQCKEDMLDTPSCGLQLPDIQLDKISFSYLRDENTLSILKRLKIETGEEIGNFIKNELFSDTEEENALYKDDVHDSEEENARYKEDDIRPREEYNRYKEDNAHLKEEDTQYKEDNVYLGEDAEYKEDNVYLGKQDALYKEDNIHHGEEIEEIVPRSGQKIKNEGRQIAWKSTNPFLQDLPADVEADGQIDVPRLNPANPFLTYQPAEEELGYESSDESCASTAYESPLVARPQHSWSTFSDMSADTISELGKSLRSKSNSSDSLKDQRSSSMQTTTQQSLRTQSPMQGDVEFRYSVPCEYPAWPDISYNANPYYSMRLANFQSLVYESPYRPRPNVPPPGRAPPPGFYPACMPNRFPALVSFPTAPQFANPRYVQQRPVGYYSGEDRAGGSVVMGHVYNIPPRVNPVNVPMASRVSSASPTSSQCDYVGAAGRDFYDFYNQSILERREGGSL